jgi:hypothetical protein
MLCPAVSPATAINTNNTVITILFSSSLRRNVASPDAYMCVYIIGIHWLKKSAKIYYKNLFKIVAVSLAQNWFS